MRVTLELGVLHSRLHAPKDLDFTLPGHPRAGYLKEQTPRKCVAAQKPGRRVVLERAVNLKRQCGTWSQTNLEQSRGILRQRHFLPAAQPNAAATLRDGLRDWRRAVERERHRVMRLGATHVEI